MVHTVKNIEQLCACFHQPARHPLVMVGRLETADSKLFAPTDFGMYCVVLLEGFFGVLHRDDVSLDYKAGTLFCIKPKQVVSTRLTPESCPRGWVIAFKPELLVKTGLGRDFYMFNFFDYDVHHALHLNEDEHKIILSCFENVSNVLKQPNDELTGHILRLSISQLLSYCKRFYNRQFAEQHRPTQGIAQRLDQIATSYLTGGEACRNGQLTVAWCAEQFHLSPNYFGDVVKRELHITAQEFVLQKTLEIAKQMLGNPNMTITEVAAELGFVYPNHFTRLFRSKLGISPSVYRKRIWGKGQV